MSNCGKACLANLSCSGMNLEGGECVLYSLVGQFNAKATEADEGVERFYVREAVVVTGSATPAEETAESAKKV